VNYQTKLAISSIPVAAYLGYLAWVIQLTNAGRLPDPVATHWSATGQPDGFASISDHLIMASIAFVVPGLIWVAVVWPPKLPQTTKKILLLVTGLLFLLLAAFQFLVIGIQIDLSDASNAVLRVEFWLLLVPVALLLFIFLAKPEVITDERLKVRVRGIAMFSCDFQEIESVGTATARARDFGGLGLRFSRGKVAFMPSAGLALEIKTKTGQTILVRSDRAEELAQQIKSKMGR